VSSSDAADEDRTSTGSSNNNGSDSSSSDIEMAPAPVSSSGVNSERTSSATEGIRRGGNRRRRHRQQPQPYSRVSSGDGDEADDDAAPPGGAVTNASAGSSIGANQSQEGTAPKFTVTVLDFAQSKFNVSVDPSWTIARFKEVSSTVHKVPPHLQRLIFRGGMLSDTKTLEESGIKEEGTIIHLFPKPRVVINNSNSEVSDGGAESGADGDDEESQPEGRIPTIVLNAEEAEMRSQILVLSSPEYLEAVNNVKIFSFMLLVISSLELMNLLAIALGAPQQAQGGGPNNSPPSYLLQDDDIFANNDDFEGGFGHHNRSATNSTPWDSNFQPNILYQKWGWPNTCDLILSIAGVYVAWIGIQASNENQLRLAKIYLEGTFLVGIGWMFFNFFVTYEIDEAVEHEHREHHPNDDFIPDMSDDDILNSALSVMVLPGLVWIMCCLRAAQFHRLLHDAEEEAESRIRAELERSQPPLQQQQPGEEEDDDGQHDEELGVLDRHVIT